MKGAIFRWALGVGLEYSRLVRAGRRPSAVLQAQRVVADRLVFQKVRALFGGRLQFFVSGSAPLSKDIAEFFDAFGVSICEGYGLTESSAATHANLPWARKLGTVGTPFAGIDVKIARGRRDPAARRVDHARLPRPAGADARGARRGRLAPHRRRRLRGRRRLPLHHRPEEGPHQDLGRQVRGADRARVEAEGAVALDRAGARARRSPQLRLGARHPRPGGDPALGGGQRARRHAGRASSRRSRG